jgi:hypothetical protein
VRLLLVLLLLFGIAEGMPVGFQPASAAIAHVDVACDGDEHPSIASASVPGCDVSMMAKLDRVLVDRLPDRPLLRPPIG